MNNGLGTGRFGDAATALCALAARGLGWRPQEFWNATPAELADCLGLGLSGAADASSGLDRTTLNKLMEQDHDR